MNTLKSIQTLCFGALTSLALGTATYATDQEVLPTSADSIETFWSAKYWTIFKNTSRQSCFIEWRSDRSVVQAGLTKAQNAAYLGAFVKDYQPPEGDHDMAISVNGNLYVGTSTTVAQSLPGALNGGYIVFDNPRFLADLVEARELIAFRDTPGSVTIKLKTPQNAINRAQDCMATF